VNDHARTQKQAMRQTLRAARRALPAAQREHETSATVTALWPLVQDGMSPLASYLALSDELDLDALHRRWWSLGHLLWLPRVSGPGTLTWHPLSSPELTVIGSYGIREPDPVRVTAVALPADATVLVPGVGFTRDGQRLGQGKGFYDRVLAEHRGHTIGIAFACQVVEALPSESHDQRVAVVAAGGELLR
jgi:5-formyltetrahydrofolate cyclo-ligase